MTNSVSTKLGFESLQTWEPEGLKPAKPTKKLSWIQNAYSPFPNEFKDSKDITIGHKISPLWFPDKACWYASLEETQKLNNIIR